jgi:hypothetical protein
MASSQPAATTQTPMVPAAHTPTPAQQNPTPTHPRTVAPYLPEPDPNAPKDPTKAFAERQKLAINSRLDGAQRASVADATEAPAKPKAPKPAAAPAAADEQAGQQANAAAPVVNAAAAVVPPAGTAPDGGTAAGDLSAAYELKAFRKWAENNPEEAAKLGRAVFQVEPTEGFIKLQNKARKVKQEIEEKHTASATKLKEQADKIAADLQQAETIAGQVRWLGDMWAASTKKNAKGEPEPDFDMVDESFKQNTGGMDLDTYLRLRARRGVSNPEQAKLRAQVARQEQELAALRGKPKEPAENASAAPPTPAPAAAAPISSAEAETLWGGEIPKSHQLREFSGWAADLDKEMKRYHDETLDEYSVDAEEIANELLQRKLAALTPAPAPAPKPPTNGARRPNTPKNRQQQPSTTPIGDGIPSAAEMTPKVSARPIPRAPANHVPGTEDNIYDAGGDAPRGYKERERWAIERAQRRARGEQVD